MEFSTKSPLLDESGKPLPERIQHVLDALTPKLRRKFSMIRDEVVLIEILEQAGQQIARREARDGPVEQLYGFTWVTLRNVAISRLRRSPELLEGLAIGSEESAVALSSLRAEESSPEVIEYNILLREVLGRLSSRERMIAIWKKAGFSSAEIAAELGMSVSCVDTKLCRLRRKVRKWISGGPDLE